MKMSPLGAVRSNLGPESPAANNLTWKPGGTESFAPAGRSTVCGELPADLVA